MNILIIEEKLRKAVIKYNENFTIQETADFFEIGTNTVSRWKAQYINEGTLTAAKTGGATYFVVGEEGKDFFVSEIAEKNDITLEELRQKYFKKFNEEISVSTIHYHLKKLNISLKKKSFYDPKKYEDRVQEERKEFVEKLIDIPEEDRYFLDETGTCMNMTPEFARASQEERAYSERPTSQGKHYTTIGILGKEGIIFHYSFQGYLNKLFFIFILKIFIIPIFSNTNKCLIMDNCSSHHNDDVENLLKENNVKYLFLPPYSPEYNPIELAWSKFKNFIKKTKSRCEFYLWLSINCAIKSISLEDIRGYFNHVNNCYTT
jgi:transposase